MQYLYNYEVWNNSLSFKDIMFSYFNEISIYDLLFWVFNMLYNYAKYNFSFAKKLLKLTKLYKFEANGNNVYAESSLKKNCLDTIKWWTSSPLSIIHIFFGTMENIPFASKCLKNCDTIQNECRGKYLIICSNNRIW